MFVVDDLVSWLVGRLADAGYQKMSTRLRGSEQDRAVKQAVMAAVRATAAELSPSDEQQADQLAARVSGAFGRRVPVKLPSGRLTLLEKLQAGISQQLAAVDDAGLTGIGQSTAITGQLAVLDDPELTGTGQSSAELLGAPGSVLAEKLTAHLLGEIVLRGSRGGPLEPLASQLNFDLLHLRGQRLEGMVARLIGQVQRVLAGQEIASKPVRLAPRPVVLAGRAELLAGLQARLAGGDGTAPRVTVLYGLGGAGKTSTALEYAHRQLAAGTGLVWQFIAEDATTITAEFSELAALLGAPGSIAGRDPVAAVHALLASRSEGWLLVFDNAPAPAAVAQVLPRPGTARC